VATTPDPVMPLPTANARTRRCRRGQEGGAANGSAGARWGATRKQVIHQADQVGNIDVPGAVNIGQSKRYRCRSALEQVGHEEREVGNRNPRQAVDISSLEAH
jgi:hypothetical protein